MQRRSVFRWIGLGFGTLVVGAMAFLLLAPVPFEPAPWDPPEAPLASGPYQENYALEPAQRVALPASKGTEDIDVDAEDRVIVGLNDGSIRRQSPEGNWELWTHTGGRPLGMAFDDSGNLVVADAQRGLLLVDEEGNIETLATEHDGVPFGFTDDVDVGPITGNYYFTDASSKYPFPDYRPDLLENRPYGRLMVFDAATRETRLLLDGLHFANGVAVSEDESFVLVNETWRYRVWKVMLTGPDAGQSEIFIDNLPGFPDGISRGENVFWVALFSPRNTAIDASSGRPWLRKMLMRMPEFLQPKPVRFGYILGLDPNGNVVANLQDAGGGFAPITSVHQAGDRLYLGSLSESAYAVLEFR